MWSPCCPRNRCTVNPSVRVNVFLSLDVYSLQTISFSYRLGHTTGTRKFSNFLDTSLVLRLNIFPFSRRFQTKWRPLAGTLSCEKNLRMPFVESLRKRRRTRKSSTVNFLKEARDLYAVRLRAVNVRKFLEKKRRRWKLGFNREFILCP